MLVNILVAWGIWVMNGPLMEFTSRTEGRNAKVAIYEDRIEWGRSGWHPPGGATAAVLTAGMSLALPGKRKDTNMIPIRQIQGVTTHRAGLRYTVVKVATAADTVEFHVSKAQAEEAKALITQLMLGGSAPVPVPVPTPAAAPPSPAASASVADELAKLMRLRDAGALTDDEFAAQKAKLLKVLTRPSGSHLLPGADVAFRPDLIVIRRREPEAATSCTATGPHTQASARSSVTPSRRTLPIASGSIRSSQTAQITPPRRRSPASDRESLPCSLLLRSVMTAHEPTPPTYSPRFRLRAARCAPTRPRSAPSWPRSGPTGPTAGPAPMSAWMTSATPRHADLAARRLPGPGMPSVITAMKPSDRGAAQPCPPPRVPRGRPV